MIKTGKMKKTALFVFAILSICIWGQKVSDFQYISVPEKFSTFKKNDYGLREVLIKFLKEKKYVIVPSDKQQWPTELYESPCNVVNADIVNDSGFLKNKVLLQFKDCNDKIILSSKGSSSIKEFEEGYKDALQKALANVPISIPVTINIAPVTTHIEHKDDKDVSSVTDKKVTRYSNGKLDLQRIQMDGKQFILVDSNSSEPYATFKEATKKDVFRVKLQNGDTTIGYLERSNIIIEIPLSNGEYSKEIFSVK